VNCGDTSVKLFWAFTAVGGAMAGEKNVFSAAFLFS
jgi:hypothetical protein